MNEDGPIFPLDELSRDTVGECDYCGGDPVAYVSGKAHAFVCANERCAADALAGVEP